MGIPLGVYLSPVLLAFAIIVTDLVNFLVPTADVGGAVWSLLDRLIDGDPGTIEAIAWILVIWVDPRASSSSSSPTSSSPGGCAGSAARASRSGWAPARRARPIPRRPSWPTS